MQLHFEADIICSKHFQISYYIWLKAPEKWRSQQLFNYLLSTIGAVGIPGNFFGSQGEGFLRLTTLGDRDEIEEVVENLSQL